MDVRGSRDFLILTNNPLVRARMEGRGNYTVRFRPEKGFRDILVQARDMVYAGHILYTHPLAGSVKPNETPYKSLAVSLSAPGFDPEHGELIANAIAVFDKFPLRERALSQSVLEDFQLIDYTLLASAVDPDAGAGFSKFD